MVRLHNVLQKAAQAVLIMENTGGYPFLHILVLEIGGLRLLEKTTGSPQNILYCAANIFQTTAGGMTSLTN